MIHARVITSTLFGEGTSWSWVVVGFRGFGLGFVDTRRILDCMDTAYGQCVHTVYMDLAYRRPHAWARFAAACVRSERPGCISSATAVLVQL